MALQSIHTYIVQDVPVETDDALSTVNSSSYPACENANVLDGAISREDRRDELWKRCRSVFSEDGLEERG